MTNKNIPDGLEFSDEQRGLMIAALSDITDLDEKVIENCRFNSEELVQVFNKASAYNNKLVALHNESEKASTHSEWGVGLLMKISSKISRYEGCLQRLSDGIVARSNMHPKPPSNS